MSSSTWVPLGRCAIAGAALLVVVPGRAHHSVGMFDQSRVVTLEGTVVRYDWRNPHVYIYLVIADENGQQVEWALESQSPEQLSRGGWSSDSMKAGDRLTVRANPHRNAQRRFGSVMTVTTTDGTTLSSRTRPRSSGAVATSLSGTWQADVQSAVAVTRSYFDVSRVAQLTEAAREASVNAEESQNPLSSCRPVPAPWVMSVPTAAYEIDIAENEVVLRGSEVGFERVVDLTTRTHAPAVALTDQGHSVGWWETDVLVVDTRYFSENIWGNGRGVPSGAQRHLVERFELNDDGTSLSYSYDLEDPEYLIGRLSGSITWQHVPTLQTTALPCDPEVARRYLTEG